MFSAVVGPSSQNVAMKVMHTSADGTDYAVVHHTALVEIHKHCGVPGMLIPLKAWILPSSHNLVVQYPIAVCNVQHFCCISSPPLQAVACIARSVAGSLAALHAKHFMHRDVTARNILLMESGETLLCDRSLVRRLWGRSMERNCYTPRVTALAYRAPEVLASRRPCYDERIDIWALGCVVAELLGQDLLFEFMEDETGKHMAAAVRMCGEAQWPASIKTDNNRLARVQRHLKVMSTTNMGTVKDFIMSQWMVHHSQKQCLDDAIDFVQRCLRLAPNERASAEELTRHPFCKWADKTCVQAHIRRMRKNSDDSGAREGGKASDACGELLSEMTRRAVRLPIGEAPVFRPRDIRGVDLSRRVGMARTASRLLWPAPSCPIHDRPAAWSVFATAMQIFDHAVIGMRGKELAPMPDALLTFGICVLASTREGRMHPLLHRMTTQEVGWHSQENQSDLRDAITRVLRAVRCDTNPPSLVDAALTHHHGTDLACSVSALYATSTPYLWNTSTTLRYCQTHKDDILKAFQMVSGFHPSTGARVETRIVARVRFVTSLRRRTIIAKA